VLNLLARERLFLGFMLAHGLLFMGLYQVGFTPSQWTDLVRRSTAQGGTPAKLGLEEQGPAGLLRAYYRTDSDERLYREYAALALTGHADLDYIASKQYSHLARVSAARAWPYRDVRIEYPPLALLLGMLPPRLISGPSYVGYRLALGGWLWLVHGASLACALAWLRSRELGPRIERQLLGFSLAFCVLLGNIVATRIDGLVALFLLLGVLAIERSQRAREAEATRWAGLVGLLAALGVLTKIVPGLLIPCGLVVWHRSQHPERRALIAVALLTGGLTLLALHAACWALLGDGYLATFDYHRLRGLQLESTYASLLLLAHLFGFPTALELSFGSSNVASSVSPTVASLSPWILLAGMAILVGWAARRERVEPLPFLCALVLCFMVTSKVLSPQYLIWISLPVLMLGVSTQKMGLVITWLVIAALSQGMYPRAYAALKHFAPPLVFMLALRNLLLGILMGCVSHLALSSAHRRSPSTTQ